MVARVLFCTRTYNRLLRPGLAQIIPEEALRRSPNCAEALTSSTQMIDQWIEKRRWSA